MTPLVILSGGETDEACQATLSLGFQAAVAVGPEAGDAARRASAAGLTLFGLLEVPEAEALVAELGAWTVLHSDQEPRARRLCGEDAVARFQAQGAPPEVLLWVTEAGEDPGPAWDEELGELVEFLQETGFEGGLGLRGADPDRLAAQYRVVRELLDAASSWWDGSEDGY